MAISTYSSGLLAGGHTVEEDASDDDIGARGGRWRGHGWRGVVVLAVGGRGSRRRPPSGLEGLLLGTEEALAGGLVDDRPGVEGTLRRMVDLVAVAADVALDDRLQGA